MNKPTRLLPGAEQPILVMVIAAQDARLNGQGYPDYSPERTLDLPESRLQHQRHWPGCRSLL